MYLQPIKDLAETRQTQKPLAGFFSPDKPQNQFTIEFDRPRFSTFSRHQIKAQIDIPTHACPPPIRTQHAPYSREAQHHPHLRRRLRLHRHRSLLRSSRRSRLPPRLDRKLISRWTRLERLHARRQRLRQTRLFRRQWLPLAQERDRIFVELYEHDIELEELDDINHRVKARVVFDGCDKLNQLPDNVELYDLKTDENDGTELSSKNNDKSLQLKFLIAEHLK